MNDNSLDYLLKKSYEDGYQKGLYDGIIQAAQNSKAAASQKRIVASGATGPDLPSLMRRSNPFFDELALDATLESFLMGRRYGG